MEIINVDVQLLRTLLDNKGQLLIDRIQYMKRQPICRIKIRVIGKNGKMFDGKASFKLWEHVGDKNIIPIKINHTIRFTLEKAGLLPQQVQDNIICS